MAHPLKSQKREYMVRASGYLQTIDDFNNIVLKTGEKDRFYLRDVARVQIGPEMRRGIAELNGGEVAGGVVILRSGKMRARLLPP